jgi:hypothetical protein
MLLRLLADEEAKLAALEKIPQRKTQFLVGVLPFSPVCRPKAEQLFPVF